MPLNLVQTHQPPLTGAEEITMKSSVTFGSYLPDSREEWDLDLYISLAHRDTPLNTITINKSGLDKGEELEVSWKVSTIERDDPKLNVLETSNIEAFITNTSVETVQIVTTTHSGATARHTFDLEALRKSRPVPIVAII